MGGVRDARPHLGQIPSFSSSFQQKFCQIIGCRPLLAWRTPSLPQEIMGSPLLKPLYTWRHAQDGALSVFPRYSVIFNKKLNLYKNIYTIYFERKFYCCFILGSSWSRTPTGNPLLMKKSCPVMTSQVKVSSQLAHLLDLSTNMVPMLS